MEYKVKDISLSDKGRLKIRWAEQHMPVLREINNIFSRKKVLKGIRIGACLHVTKETAVLVKVFKHAGAEVALAASNPLSTQDEVAAALVEEGIHVFAWRGMSWNDYYDAIARVISFSPNITLDDGADLTGLIHKLYYKESGKEVDLTLKIIDEQPDKIVSGIRGGTEETTTGVIRLRALAKEKRLLYPIIAVNDSLTKFLFDNRYGTGQSCLDGIIRVTNILFAGKNVVVAGYGWVGRGIALRARGLGARVIIVETDPIKALEAYYDGFYVTNMYIASKIGDIFITATGDINVIRKEHFVRMKNGAILANAGHFNVEISIDDLEKISQKKEKIRENITEYILHNGRKIYLLAEGRLINLAGAEGHPSEVMDMSFSNQALAVKYLLSRKLSRKVYVLPRNIDNRIALLKLKALGVKIEKLTYEQKKYLSSWEAGT